jgi:DegT/DnrJ/EryC1/StrS aminotransferase family.
MFNKVEEFEKEIAKFYGAPYAVATDCCTHAIELCLRHRSVKRATIPKHTYLSVPMTLEKLSIEWNFNDEQWTDHYQINGTNIIDAAVLWRENSYIPNTFMCLSFQFKNILA